MIKHLNVFKRSEGLSIVELMIVLSLLGIVLALSYMYFGFGVQAFDRGEQRAIAQQASRLTSGFITSELRFASEIEINPGDTNFESGFRYIYLENESIKYINENGDIKILADSSADGMDYSIFFTSNVPYDVVYFYIFADFPSGIDIGSYIIVDPDNDIWEFEEERLEDEVGTGLYFLKTKVQALNLELYKKYGPDEEMIDLNDKGGTIIKYKVPDS